MSASQQKRNRQEQREKGLDKRQLEQLKIEKAQKRSKTAKIVSSIIAVILVLAIIVLNTNLLYNNFTAVKVGDVSYTAAEYNFFYNYTVDNYLNQYGQYLSMIGLDTTKPYDQQEYFDGTGKTWADFFTETTQDSMKQVTALNAAAEDAGFKLSEEDQANLDSNIASLDTSYEGSEYTNADSFLSSLYGRGVSVAVVSSILEKSFVATAYSEHMNDSFTYTSDELKAYYAQSKNDLDNYTYISYLADGSVPETASTDSPDASTDTESASSTDVASPTESADTSVDSAAAMASAKSIADSIIASASTVDAFKAAVLAQTQNEASESTTQGKSLTAAYADWLKDVSRVAGDKTVIETESGYYALYYIGRDSNDYSTVNVRHILINVTASEDGTYSDEAKATAKQKAEELLATWKSGEATEDSFATLANENSEDTGSNTTGGLYEDVYKGQMVTDFNDWCFAAGRTTGDTGIVYNEGSYTGYHVIYFVGQGELYADKLSEDDLRTQDYTEWQTSLLANYEVTTGFTAVLVK